MFQHPLVLSEINTNKERHVLAQEEGEWGRGQPPGENVIRKQVKVSLSWAATGGTRALTTAFLSVASVLLVTGCCEDRR